MALVDVHIGRQLPPSWCATSCSSSILYGLTGPVMRAWCGIAYVRRTHMSKFCGRRLFIASVMMFMASFSFAADVRLALQEAV